MTDDITKLPTPALPGPFRVEGTAIKCIDHGHWYTVARAEAAPHFTKTGAENTAAYFTHTANNYVMLVKALEDICKAGYDIDLRGIARAALAKST
jgi:hypothetical protein